MSQALDHTSPAPHRSAKAPPLKEEVAAVWRQLPDKGLFFGLLAAWLLLFQFFGNATLGYVNTPSLFGWLEWMYTNSDGDEDHGRLIPFAVLALLWWKRRELIAVPKRPWWPATLMLIAALLLHALGSMVQQTQLCAVAFFGGLYALMGIAWGPRWLVSSFFPMCLFAFCVPIRNVSEFITFPLRLAATKITAFGSQTILGINVIHDGTRIFDSLGQYQYEVAAACSGIRSLTAILALAVVCAFMMHRSLWRRLLMILSAIPLAVAANVVRLGTIIVAAEAFGQKAGDAAHDSSWLSLMPYIPAILGILLLSRLLREKAPSPPGDPPVALVQPAQPSL
jgi:exosortase